VSPSNTTIHVELAKALDRLDQHLKAGHRFPSRAESRTVACPTCGALPGDLCKGKRGVLRVSSHMERAAVYVASIGA
jgi:hypothetical protein